MVYGKLWCIGQLMLDVYENYDKYKVKGKKQMIVNKETFHTIMKEKLNSNS